MNKIKQLVKNVVKWCYVTRASSDNKSVQISQVSYLEKVADCVMITPYGLYGNPPVNSLGVMLCVEGEEQNRAAIVNVTDSRIKGLLENEVATGNPITGTYIKYDKNANMIMIVKNNLTINITKDNDITIGGNYNLNISGQGTITASQLVIDANVVINGTITANNGGGSVTMSGGALTTSGDVVAGGISLKTHTHGGVTRGGGSTDAPS